MADIICADRDPEVRETYRRVLEEQQHAVRLCAAAAAEVVAAFDARAADMVIVEVAEPDLAGITTCTALRQHPGAQYIPILAVVPAYHEFIILEALRGGADDCLVKPVNEDRLLMRVFVLLERTSHLVANVGFVEGGLFAGTYEINQVIGQGSYSIVYLARDTTREGDDALTALKVYELEGHDRTEDEYRSFFLREAYEMSKLRHPCIARFHDFGKADQHYYLAMEYVRGQSLLQYVKKNGRLDDRRALLLAYNLASALEYLSAHRVIHRDIKPNNILLSTTGEVKLVDFGLAKQQMEMTRTAQQEKFRGTPEYVSPEQIRGEEVDIRSDIYSLGATLYYASAAVPPYTGKSTVEKIIANLETDPEPLHEVNPSVSPGFSFIVHRMMAKNRDFRYQPSELKQDLERLMQHAHLDVAARPDWS